MKLSLTSRIILSFVLLSAVLLTTVGVFSYRRGSKSLQADAMSEMLAKAIEKEAALDAWIAERLSDIREIAGHADVVEKAANLIAAAPASQEARSAHAILLQELQPYVGVLGSNFTEMFVIEAESGRVVASTSPSQEGKTKLGHPYFDQGRTNLSLQPAYYSADTAALAMTAAIPLRASDGRVVAVLAARMDLAVINIITQRRTGLHQTEDSFLFNAGQFPLTQPRFMTEPVVLRRKLDTEAVRLCVAGKSGVILTKDYRRVPSIAVYRWDAMHQFGLIVKIDQAEALAPVRAFGRSVVLISLLALFTAAGLALVLAGTITRPLRALQDRVRRFAEGNKEGPPPEITGDEITLVAGEFERMAGRVAERTAELAKANLALQVENAARKRTGEQLRVQATALDAAANAIFITDHNGVIQSVNPAFTALTGYTAGEAVGQNPRLLKSGKQDEAFYRNLWQTISSGQVWSGQLTNRRKDGSLYTEEMTITPLRDAAGAIARYIAIKQDISERKRAEEALRASQQIIEGIINAIPVRVFWKDKNLVYLGCNAVFARDAGFADPKDIIGKDDYQMGWRDQAEKYRGDDRQVIESGCSKLLIEEPQTTPAGNTITLLSSKIPLRGSKGEISGVLGTYMDITERKRAEEELRASEKKYQDLFVSSRDALMTLEPPSWRFTSGNLAAVKMYGAKSEEEFISYGPWHLSPERQPDGRVSAEKAREMIEKAMREGSSFFEWTHRRIGGEEFPATVLITRIQSGEKVFLQATVRDITEFKRAQVELEDIHKQVLESSRLAGMAEIATNVLHNVGNALNSVNISTDLIVDAVKKSKASSLARIVALLEEHARDLGEFITQDPNGRHVPAHLARLSEHLMAEQANIAGELDSLRRNVEHIKDIVAMQQNYATIGGVKEMTDLVSLVEDSLRLNEDALRRHGVEVVRQLEKVPPMNFDKHKILQILVNLVRNAKYACDESGRADGRVTVRVANGDGRVRISVMDNGIGIPPENLTRIFNYGFTTRMGGHGFGLHGSALAAKEMGGTLTAQSGGPGQGAAFTLELPCPTRENTHE